MNQINLDQKTHNCIQKESDESMTTQIKIQTKKMIEDKIFPSIQEVSYCIKHDKLGGKDMILYKMLIDFYEAMNNKNGQDSVQGNSSKNVENMVQILLPCSMKFYRKLDQTEMDKLVFKMQEINCKVSSKIQEVNKNQKSIIKYKNGSIKTLSDLVGDIPQQPAHFGNLFLKKSTIFVNQKEETLTRTLVELTKVEQYLHYYEEQSMIFDNSAVLTSSRKHLKISKRIKKEKQPTRQK